MSHGWALIHRTLFRDSTFKEVIELHRGQKGGALIQYDCCSYWKRDTREAKPREDTQRRWPSADQGDKPTCQDLGPAHITPRALRR